MSQLTQERMPVVEEKSQMLVGVYQFLLFFPQREGY